MIQDELNQIRKKVDEALGPKSCVLSLYEACLKMPSLLAEIERLTKALRELYGDDRAVEELLSLTPSERITHLKSLVKRQREEIVRLRKLLEDMYYQAAITQNASDVECAGLLFDMVRSELSNVFGYDQNEIGGKK